MLLLLWRLQPRTMDRARKSWTYTKDNELHHCFLTHVRRTKPWASETKIRPTINGLLPASCRRPPEKRTARNYGKKQAPEGLLKLTRRGIFLSDGIMSDLLYVPDWLIPHLLISDFIKTRVHIRRSITMPPWMWYNETNFGYLFICIDLTTDIDIG